MESLIVLAGLFFIGGPILLLFLVIGARSRVRILEDQVKELQWEVQQLANQPSAKTAETPAPVAESVSSAATSQPQATDFNVFDWQEKREIPAAAIPLKDLPRDTTLTVEPKAPLSKIDTKACVAIEEDAVVSASATEPKQGITDDAVYVNATEPETIDGAERFEMQPPAWLVSAKEWLFGGNLVAKAGLLILFIGVSFLLKYAAARVTVPIELRLSGIVLADIGLLLWGWRIRESRPSISLPVQGAALGIMMLVTFGAFRLYDLIPGTLAFALLFLLTAFTCVLAVLQNAVWLAVFGIVGGFAAPILTSTGQGSHIGLFSYYALLNAGILAIALKRSWRLLNLLGFAFTFVIATTWGVLRYQPENYASVQGFLALFLLFYVAISILYANRQAPRLKHYVDGTLVFGTPLVAFGLQYGIVRDKPFGLAFSALALGLFYITLTLALWKRRGDSLKLLVESFLALGIVFGTLAIPFALDGRWTSAAWALEGAGIVWVGLRQKQTLAWVFGVLVQVGAWMSFIASMAGIDRTLAAESNLWLGFLLLAGTGFIMAMNFRKEVGERREDEDEDSPSSTTRILAWLATGFLGFAALWLMAGAWTEILLRGGAHTHTLLVVSAMAVAGVLGVITKRLDWGASRYFALVPQVVAGLVFLWFSYRDFDWFPHASSDNLFDTGFLGGLLIALAAAVSSLAFQRQPDARHLSISRMLLGWCGFWWFVQVLGSVNTWGAHILHSYNLFAETAYPRVYPLYGLCIALTTPLFARLSRRLAWPDLRWLAAAVWPCLLFVIARMLEQLNGYADDLPAAPVWAALVTLWLAGEWLMHDDERDGWLRADDRPVAMRALHALRTVGPWLIIWPLGHRLVNLALSVDSSEQAALLAEAGWFTAGSWARYLPAWAMMAVIALLIPRARTDRWPTLPISGWYRRILIPLGAAGAIVLAAVWNLTQNGRMEPLPYLPILNPLDLTTGFAALLAIAAYRLRALDSDHPPALAELLPKIGAVAAYLWFNLMLLRTAAHFLEIPYQIEPLFRSQFVQAMLSLVWSATALVLMRFAAGRRLRAPWMAGAGLLVLVVAKLFLVDLSNVGGVERIISFLGVGALMLAIGYLAPFPSEPKTEQE